MSRFSTRVRRGVGAALVLESILQQQNTGIWDGTSLTVSLPSAPATSSTLVLIIAGNTTVTTPSGWTLRTSQVNYMGHYLYTRTGTVNTSWSIQTAAGAGTWWLGEITNASYDNSVSSNQITEVNSYTTPDLMPSSGSKMLLASLASSTASSSVRTVSDWTNGFNEIADLCNPITDYPMQGVAASTVDATGSTVYNTGATYSLYGSPSAILCSLSLNTAGGSTADTTPPTTPTSLSATPHSMSVSLSWTASTDNVGVTGYEYSLDGAAYSPTGSTATTYTVTGLSSETAYTIYLRAVDDAGNRSQPATVNATTTAVAPMDSDYSGAVMTDSPQLYYAMQERRGATVLTDTAGGGQDATVFGAIAVDDAWSPYHFAPNAVGRHISIYNETSNDQYVQLPANSIDVTEGFSFEMWVWPIGWNWNTMLVDFGDIKFGYVYQQPQFVFAVGSTEFVMPMAEPKKWHHIVGTVQKNGGANSAKVYIDGVLAGSGSVGALTQIARPEMYLARSVSGSGNFYRGYMTQVAVYGHELSASRVVAHYEAGMADADPAWHGPDEWYDKTYFNQFTNGSVLANNNYVPIGDWMPPVLYSTSDIANMRPYVDIGVAVPQNTNYSWYRDNDMYLLPGVGGPLTGTRGTETIGYFIDDEADMYGQEGLNRMTANMAAAPAGYMTYANFGIFITMGMGDPNLTKEQFFNMPGLHVKSVDQYLYSMDMSNDTNALTYWGVPNTALRRAFAYGKLVERARSVQDVPRPLWAFVELAHPYNAYTTGGPNPNQVEGAVWGSIIGGARGIMYFHHSFGIVQNDVFVDPDPWDPTTDYPVCSCVTYNDTLYYAALKPAVGETPSLSSYTWVRWIRNSVPGIDDASARHPDLPARLIKIKADLQTAAPAINSPTTPHLCHKDIYSTYRPAAHDGRKYIFAMPGLGAPNGGTFDMYVPKGETPDLIEVVGENRSIVPFTSGGRLKFSDTFAGEYSHHIYRW